MSDYHKVLLRQLQFAGLGLIVVAAGFLTGKQEGILLAIGTVIFLYGMIRFCLIYNLLKKEGSSPEELEKAREDYFTPVEEEEDSEDRNSKKMDPDKNRSESGK